MNPALTTSLRLLIRYYDPLMRSLQRISALELLVVLDQVGSLVSSKRTAVPANVTFHRADQLDGGKLPAGCLLRLLLGCGSLLVTAGNRLLVDPHRVAEERHANGNENHDRHSTV